MYIYIYILHDAYSHRCNEKSLITKAKNQG